MWQRFSADARTVVFYAQEEAQARPEHFVSTEHLLLALLRMPESTALKMLESIPVDKGRLRTEVTSRMGPAGLRKSVDMTLTPRAKRVIDLAYGAARDLGSSFIGTEHILLGLAREEGGVANQALLAVGASYDVLLAALASVGSDEEAPTIGNLKEAMGNAFSARRATHGGSGNAPERLLLLFLGDHKTDLSQWLAERGSVPGQLIDALTSHLASKPKAGYREFGFTDLLAAAEMVRAELGQECLTAGHFVAAITRLGETFAAEALALRGLDHMTVVAKLKSAE